MSSLWEEHPDMVLQWHVMFFSSSGFFTILISVTFIRIKNDFRISRTWSGFGGVSLGNGKPMKDRLPWVATAWRVNWELLAGPHFSPDSSKEMQMWNRWTTSCSVQPLVSHIQPITWMPEEWKCSKWWFLLLKWVAGILEGYRPVLDINKVAELLDM